MKNKYRIIISILVSIFTMLTTSCEQNPTTQNYKIPVNVYMQLNTFRDTIEYIGATHNIMLDSFIVNLNRIKNDSSYNFTYDNLTSLLLTISVPYYENEGFNITSMIDTSQIEIDTTSRTAYQTGLLDTSLSATALNYLSRIDNIIDLYFNNTINYFFLSDSLNNIITQASTLNKKYEYLIVGVAASIAKNSCYYWVENNGLSKIDNYLGENSGKINYNNKKQYQNPKIQMTAKEKRIIYSDISSGVAGLIEGAKWGAIAGGIAGAVAGGIAGGLISGSVGSLTVGIMNELGFPWWLIAIVEGLQ